VVASDTRGVNRDINLRSGEGKDPSTEGRRRKIGETGVKPWTQAKNRRTVDISIIPGR